MKVRVIDIETSDSSEAKAAGKPAGICEWGYTDVFLTDNGFPLSMTRSGLVNPGHPMSHEALAVHHITDEMVKDCLSPTHACRQFMSGMEEGDLFAAHYAEFEQNFFGGGAFEWICTFKCARHLYPDLDRHTNQVLRYALGLDRFMNPTLAMPPHRAGPDSYVTAHILREMFSLKSPTELVNLSTQPVLLKTLTFGQYQGKKYSEVPTSYLDWILGKDFDEDVKHTARHWKEENRKSPF